MPIDPNISLGIKPVEMPNPLQMALQGSQLQNQMQQAQSGGIDLQAKIQANQERQNLLPFFSDKDNFMTDGNIDMKKLNAAIPKLAPQTGADILDKLSKLSNAQTTAAQAAQNLTQSQRALAGGVIGALSRAGIEDPRIYANELDNLVKQNPNNEDLQNLVGSYKSILSGMKPGKPVVASAMLASQSLLTPAEQQASLSKKAEYLQTGGSNVPITVSPQVAGNEPSIEQTPGGVPILNTLSPQTPTMRGNTPGYVGQAASSEPYNPNPSAQTNQGSTSQNNQQQASGLDLSQLTPEQQVLLAKTNPQAFANGVADFQATTRISPQAPQKTNTNSSFVPSGLEVGASGNVENNYTEMNRHYASLQDQASGAPLLQALGGNIKSLASTAITGTEAQKKSYAVGLLNAFGWGNQATGDLQKDTDLLEKNIAQLNLGSPASTDAMRTLINAARPHSTMSAGAIKEAVDQLSGQIKANMAVRDYLTQYKTANNGQGDPIGYQQARQAVEKVADPRVWQYEDLVKQQKAPPGTPGTPAYVFFHKLPAQDQKQLIQKVQTLEKMGILQ